MGSTLIESTNHFQVPYESHTHYRAERDNDFAIILGSPEVLPPWRGLFSDTRCTTDRQGILDTETPKSQRQGGNTSASYEHLTYF